MSQDMRNFIKPDEEKLKVLVDTKRAFFNKEITLEEAREKLIPVVKNLKPWEFAYAEQVLKGHVDDDSIEEHVDELLVLLDGILEPLEKYKKKLAPPAQAYIDEGVAIMGVIDEIKAQEGKPYIHNVWAELQEKLAQWKIHTSRKQNQLYPALERKGFDRPTVIMWVFDDDIRDAINDFGEAIEKDLEDQIEARAEMACKQIKGMVHKERDILIPTAMELLDEQDWAHMAASDHEIGFCLIDEPEYVRKAAAAGTAAGVMNMDATPAAAAAHGAFREELTALLNKYGMITDTFDPTSTILDVANGKLTLEQINLIYRHLPVDLSYVDENNTVKFYSDTAHRVFPRSAGVIGRDVKNCHPRSSVHVVEELIDKFKSGEQDKAEFWIEAGDKFIYILYVAVRDENGNYRGTLEMMQEASHIRSLEGSRTLLTWEDEEGIAKPEEEEQAADNDAPTDEEAIASVHGYGFTPDSKLAEVFEKYPYIKDYMKELSPKYDLLSNPVVGKTMPKIATLSMVAGVGGFEVNDLIAKIDTKIAETEK